MCSVHPKRLVLDHNVHHGGDSEMQDKESLVKEALFDLEQANTYFEQCLHKYCTGQKVSMKEVDRAFRDVKKEMRLVREKVLRKKT